MTNFLILNVVWLQFTSKGQPHIGPQHITYFFHVGTLRQKAHVSPPPPQKKERKGLGSFCLGLGHAEVTQTVINYSVV